MSSSQIVQNMISFIEEKERDLQAAKAIGNVKPKSDVVNQILAFPLYNRRIRPLLCTNSL